MSGNRPSACVWAVVLAACLLPVVSGCESLQRKFVRKPKTEPQRPSPIIAFQDYSGAMTPLERYRKHYIMFDYWNQDMIDALQARTPNPKRYRRASEESLGELETLQSLLNDEVAGRIASVVEERAKIDKQAQSQEFRDAAQSSWLVRQLESQTRQIHREFFWRDVQESLKVAETPKPAPTTQADAAVH